jgi:hypothetical protein
MFLSGYNTSTTFIRLFWDITLGMLNHIFKPLFIWRHLITEINKALTRLTFSYAIEAWTIKSADERRLTSIEICKLDSMFPYQQQTWTFYGVFIFIMSSWIRHFHSCINIKILFPISLVFHAVFSQLYSPMLSLSHNK